MCVSKAHDSTSHGASSALSVVVNELDGEVKAHHGDECGPEFSTGHHTYSDGRKENPRRSGEHLNLVGYGTSLRGLYIFPLSTMHPMLIHLVTCCGNTPHAKAKSAWLE